MHLHSFAGVVGLGLALGAIGCAMGEEIENRPGPHPDSGIGGSAGSSVGSGGSGAATGSGGSSGGGTATGGSTGTGGATGTGGSTGTGGKGGTGGGSGSGGATGTGGTGPTSRVFFDDFEDGNATMPSWIDGDPTLGATWSVVARESRVYAQSATVSDWVISVSGDYRWTDQVVEATVKRTTAGGMVGIFGRVLDMRNYYFLYFDDANIILRKRVNGSSANLAKVKFPVVSGTAYNLKLSIVGSTLTGYVDGMMWVTGTDTGITTGGIGVGTSDSATGEFDNVSVSR